MYERLIHLLKDPMSPRKFLDLGTCLGQDLRKMCFDGVPVDRLYGTDLFPRYETIGHRLFRDAATLQGRFLVADLLEPREEDALAKTAGSWDVINIIMFLHIWDWET